MRIGILLLFTAVTAFGEYYPAPDPNAPTPKPYFASFETYGSKTVTAARVKADFKKEIDTLFQLALSQSPKVVEHQKRLTQKILKKYKMAYGEWTVMEYFKPDDLALRVTLNFVEKKDAKRRMPFFKAPSKKLGKDPGGLLKAWRLYVLAGTEIASQGKLNLYEVQCKKSFHCLYGHDPKELKSFETTFVTGVLKHKKALINIVKNDRDPERRAHAVFLLAYLPNGNEVIKLMVRTSRDPHPLVRSNALRVLGDIAEFHPTLGVPFEPVLRALDYPLVTDRSKAAYALIHMAKQSPVIKRQVQAKALPYLLKLLSSQQPNEAEPAYTVLKEVSGKSYPKTALSRWKGWAERLPAAKK